MAQDHDFESPVDLPRSPVPHGHPLRWTTLAISVAAFFLLLTNAISLRDWIEEQPVGPLQAKAETLVERWSVWTDQAALGAPRAAVRRLWETTEAIRFDETMEETAGDQR